MRPFGRQGVRELGKDAENFQKLTCMQANLRPLVTAQLKTSSVVGSLLSMHKALSLIPSAAKTKQKS